MGRGGGAAVENGPKGWELRLPRMIGLQFPRAASVPSNLNNHNDAVSLPTAEQFSTPKVVEAARDAPRWPSSKVRFSDPPAASASSSAAPEDPDETTTTGLTLAAEPDAADPGAGFLRSKCFCGSVTLSIDLSYDTVSASVCHCHNCRRLSGGPFLMNIILPKEVRRLPPTYCVSSAATAARDRPSISHRHTAAGIDDAQRGRNGRGAAASHAAH